MSAPYYADDDVTLYLGDALAVMTQMQSESVGCVVTSPPYYGLRDYGVADQLGAEATPADNVERLHLVLGEARRVLAADGTLWLNLGDSYSLGNGSKTSTPQQSRSGRGVEGPRDLHASASRVVRTQAFASMPPAKNLLGIPWRVAFALQDDGWILRNAIVWAKPNAMPESVTDRLSSRHELVFMFSRSPRYWFDLDAIREDVAYPDDRRSLRGQASGHIRMSSATRTDFHPNGRNPGDVWTIPTQPFAGSHFACMPIALAERCIRAGCRPGATVLDPFSGSGTTGLAASKHGRRYVGIDLNAEYLDMSLRTRLAQTALQWETP